MKNKSKLVSEYNYRKGHIIDIKLTRCAIDSIVDEKSIELRKEMFYDDGMVEALIHIRYDGNKFQKAWEEQHRTKLTSHPQ